jgi:hypothetical protein
MQAVVEAVDLDDPPIAPALGQCWMVGASPTGAWAGQLSALAAWTDGGWQFVAPRTGTVAWSVADGTTTRFDGASWQTGALTAAFLSIGGRQVVGARQSAIVEPAGGAIVDAEARTAISAVLGALRAYGLISE